MPVVRYTRTGLAAGKSHQLRKKRWETSFAVFVTSFYGLLQCDTRVCVLNMHDTNQTVEKERKKKKPKTHTHTHNDKTNVWSWLCFSSSLRVCAIGLNELKQRK